MTDNELIEFAEWYKGFHGTAAVEESVFNTCACGWFHSFPRQVKDYITRMEALGLISRQKGKIEIKEHLEHHSHAR